VALAIKHRDGVAGQALLAALLRHPEPGLSPYQASFRHFRVPLINGTRLADTMLDKPRLQIALDVKHALAKLG